MRRMLYLGLTEALKELKDEADSRLSGTLTCRNEQVEFIEQEEPFDTPAVFIEFDPCSGAHWWYHPAGRCTFPAACGHEMARKRKGREYVSG